MRPRPFSVLYVLASAAGLFFASFATSDFVQHLDRQVHGIHCSFIPGIEATDASGASGCHATMMSPYSSVLRDSIWGGLPISLPGMAVFAFLLFRGLDLVFNRREDERGATAFLALAAVLPTLTSAVMAYISLHELDAACKLCIGIYGSSVVALVAGIGAWRSAAAPRLGEEMGIVGEPSVAETDPGMKGHVLSFGQGVGFVAVPVLVYGILAPDYSSYTGKCGVLEKPGDPNGVMISMDENTGGVPSIEVFDPLCPSCRAFERRLQASGLATKLHRQAVLFPLDNTCNWNLASALHPGACAVSMAVLCAGERSDLVIDWAFEQQEAIKAASASDPAAGEKMVKDKFPDLVACMGSAQAKSKLNKSLRWAVSNRLAVLTPQLFVDGVKLCDEDTDLGMDYALTKLLEKQAAGTLKPAKETP